jgi:hypothetical protein
MVARCATSDVAHVVAHVAHYLNLLTNLINYLKILLIILILIGGILLEINLSGKTKKVEKEVEKEKVSEFSQIADDKVKECQIESEERIARGNSLAPMIKDGENVKVLFGYYKCSDVKSGKSHGVRHRMSHSASSATQLHNFIQKGA